MIKVENYPKAYMEVYEILKNVDKKDLKRIPKDFISMVKKNRERDYNFKLDYNKKIEEQELMRETKAILAYIFVNYWSTKEQKRKIEQKFRQDILKNEKLKEKKFSTDVFGNKRIKEKTIQIDNMNLTEYKKENFIIKIIKKIRKLFYRI